MAGISQAIVIYVHWASGPGLQRGKTFLSISPASMPSLPPCSPERCFKEKNWMVLNLRAEQIAELWPIIGYQVGTYFSGIYFAITRLAVKKSSHREQKPGSTFHSITGNIF